MSSHLSTPPAVTCSPLLGHAPQFKVHWVEGWGWDLCDVLKNTKNSACGCVCMGCDSLLHSGLYSPPGSALWASHSPSYRTELETTPSSGKDIWFSPWFSAVGQTLPGQRHREVNEVRSEWEGAVMEQQGHLLWQAKIRKDPTHFSPGPPPTFDDGCQWGMDVQNCVSEWRPQQWPLWLWLVHTISGGK